MVKGYIHSVETFGTLDGPGIRFVVFMQGCPLQCKYCHNRDTWEMRKGQEISVEELAADLKRYLDFYQNSGGGVTVSGGEPLLQSAFVTGFFNRVRGGRLHTALDTSGYADPESVIELLQLTDLVILDIKHIDSQRHKELTGVGNEKILAFARYLAQIEKPLWVRQVLIPGINNAPEDLSDLADFLRGLSSLQKIELLGYHKLGTHKWPLAGCEDPLAYIAAAQPSEVEGARRFLRDQGINNVT